MPFNHIMVDIETTGTNPVHNAMIQLSAVRFDFAERKIDFEMFDQCLHIPANRYWSEDTRDWWAQQDPKILDKIWANMREPSIVLRMFRQWALRDLDGENVILWAKPIHFEYPFLENYFKEYGVSSPFHYRYCEDLNSWCRARGFPKLDHEVEMIGDAHNAIDDVLHQIQVLFTLLEKTDGPLV